MEFDTLADWNENLKFDSSGVVNVSSTSLLNYDETDCPSRVLLANNVCFLRRGATT
jgi:hypothetical protein